MRNLFVKYKKRKGFTLIELMIVVAIIGILAAVAVPMFLNYIRNSKTAEASINLKALGDGALTFFSTIKTAIDGSLTAASTVSSITNEYPATSGSAMGGAHNTLFDSWQACTTSGNNPAGQDNPVVADFDLSPWKDLKFAINKPHYYQYCIVSDSIDEFEAESTASLDGGSADSKLQIRGEVNTNAGGREAIMSAVEDVTGEVALAGP